MGGIINFVSDNYVWFIVITVILIFALIGYIVDSNNSSKSKKEAEQKIEIVENKPLNEVVESNKTDIKEIKKETYDEPLVIEDMNKSEENKQ